MTKIAEPLYSDFLAEKLGASQQKVMSLTVENRALKKEVERLLRRIEHLENRRG